MGNIVNRTKNMILKPKATWEVIKTEETSAAMVLSGYLFPLTLIPAIASFVGFGLIGFNTGFFGRAANIEWGISQSITTFVNIFVGVIISAWIISQLAPKFGATLTMNNAVKLVAYSYTSSIVAGVFYLIPALTIIVILGGLYSLYLLYLGFQPMTGVSEEQNMAYFLVSVIAIIVVSVALTFIFGALLTTFGLASYHSATFFQ
jgi:hypothetical protein